MTSRNTIKAKSSLPEYAIWKTMKQRCLNSKCREYKYYGARGIGLCDSWNKFENFILDMGSRPSDSHSIDRINNDLGYFKENCRWATRKEQSRNKRSNLKIEYNGKIFSAISELAEYLGMDYTLLRSALSRMPIEKAAKYKRRPKDFNLPING
jgi:hypothetical protein